MIGRWWAKEESPDDPQTAWHASGSQDTAGWLEMVPGAWSYQLPAEPARPYPIAVWYRIPFHASYVPEKLDLIVDGFAGSEWKLFVNSEEATEPPVRSQIDSQMKAVDITRLVREGDNMISLRLVVTNPTDGLLDLLKLVGSFRLDKRQDGSYTIVEPVRGMLPASWTEQGYPYYSGRGVYRCRFQLPEHFTGQRIFLEPRLLDDAVEVVLNDRSAGVRLWPPYGIEVTDLLQPGDNLLELRVANTLVNLLEATARPSGLCGAPELFAYPAYDFTIE
jgi:hypothetical protein